jgi:hypothetical protein
MVVVLVEAMNAHTPGAQAAGVVWVMYTSAFIKFIVAQSAYAKYRFMVIY